MQRWITHLARLLGAAAGTFAGVVAVQLMRLRRMEFLPGHPGFSVNHVVPPSSPDERRRPRARLVVLGDSTTAGVGVDRAEDSLPYQLARRLADHERRPVHVVSYGWAGARAADVAEDQLPRAMQPLHDGETAPFLAGADFVAVVVGSNDATHQTAPRLFRRAVRSALAGVRSAAPEARIALAGIPAFRGALRAIEPLIFIADQYGRLLRRIGRDQARRLGAAYADLAAEVPRRIDRSTPFLSSDQFHPSAVGYAIWADVIFEAIVTAPADDQAAIDLPLEPAGA